MNTESSLIVAPVVTLPVISLNANATELKELALSGSALIGRVENAAQNDEAVRAQIELHRIITLFERERKRLKEPYLEGGRAIDRFVAGELLELQKEEGRILRETSTFAQAERERVREEERKQREELARIEREKQAELKRIADEQARIEREAKEAREAADKLERKAENEKQRHEAEAARVAAEIKAQEARQQAVQTQLAAQQVEEKAAERTYIESRPIEPTRAKGQRVTTDWTIQVVNPYELARLHPDCVKIEPLLGQIKAALNAGRTIAGITAEKITVAGVRVGPGRPALNV